MRGTSVASDFQKQFVTVAVLDFEDSFLGAASRVSMVYNSGSGGGGEDGGTGSPSG